MATERTYKTQGLIVRKTKLGEADRILTIFTPNMGKIQGFAKSVRKTQSKLTGHLELLTYSDLTLTKGRGLDTIIGSQNINAFLDIKNDLNRVSYALYIAEVIDSFTDEGTSDEKLFNHTIFCLSNLGKTAYPTYLLRYFEMKLLIYTGFGPELGTCVICHDEIKINEKGGFSPSAGGMLCKNCKEHSNHYGYSVSTSAYQELLKLEFNKWEEIKENPPDPDTLCEIESLLRKYIRYTLDKDIKSLSWLDYLKHLTKQITY